jgi:hypothetical protein
MIPLGVANKRLWMQDDRGQVGPTTISLANRLVPDKRCQLNWWTQHFLGVYSQEFEILKFFWDADLTAAPLCPDPLAYNQTGRFP